MRKIKFKARCDYHEKDMEITVFSFRDFSASAVSGCCQEMSSVCSCSRLSQFTGFVDSEGKEIYEQDIIQLTYREEDVPQGLFEVKFMDGHWFISQIFGELSTCSSLQFLSDVVEEDEVKIVGNIFDNSELVEKNLDSCLS